MSQNAALPDWTRTSRPDGDLAPSVCFPLTSIFHHWEGDRELPPEAVPLPPFARPGQRLLAAGAAKAHQSELAAHYRALIEVAARHGQTYEDFSALIELKSVILNREGEEAVLLSIEGNLEDLEGLRKWLVSPGEPPFFDADQGWELDMAQMADRLFVSQLDDPMGKELINVSMSLSAFRNALEASVADAREVIAALAEAVGADVWTRYVPTAIFGTATWKPVRKAVRNDAPMSWRRPLGAPFSGEG